jgi:hypothetical protein
LPNAIGIDLEKEIYTVNFLSREPLSIKFHLNQTERERISEQYNKIGITPKSETIEILNDCVSTPHIFTLVTITDPGFEKKIRIYEDCGSYEKDQIELAKSVNKFINLVYETVRKQPELKDVPNSDIIN